MKKIFGFVKDTLLDKLLRPSHKRVIAYLSWVALFIALLVNIIWKIITDPTLLYIFGGLCAGAMGFSLGEKGKFVDDVTKSVDDKPTDDKEESANAGT